MNKNTGIIIGVLVLILIVVGAYASMNNTDTMADKKTNDSAMMKDEEVVKDNQMMDEKEVDMMDEKEEGSSEVMMKGSYEAYASNKLMRAETGDVVLFFHATWCPSCRGLNSDIENNINSIPAGVSILKVDYDKETELKKKYGVTYQHTLVQVDKDGNLIKKWSGGSTLSNLISQIQ